MVSPTDHELQRDWIARAAHGRPTRCDHGRIYRYDGRDSDGAEGETDIGKCPDCNGLGCDRADRAILTSHVFPPIPDRSNDWCAFRDGDEENPGNYGWGATKEAAIRDLIENVEGGE